MSVVIKILFLFSKNVPNAFNRPIDFVFKQPRSQAGNMQSKVCGEDRICNGRESETMDTGTLWALRRLSSVKEYAIPPK